MNNWRTYERKRAAFERKWQAVILRALNRQTLYYVEQYKAGRIHGAMPDLGFYELLLTLYGNVGGRFARETNRELRSEARRGRMENRRYSPEDSRLPARAEVMAKGLGSTQLKADPIFRGSLGFNLDWAKKVADKLRDAALRLAQKISEKTRQIILSILEDAQTQNLTLDETVALIQEKAGELNKARAEAIARTEVGRAATEGKMQGAKALGVELEKVWVSARDSRTRHNPTKDPKKGDHWVLNGQRRALDEPFSNGVHQLMQPGDATAPPGETINCRCTVVFEVKKDVQGRVIERNYLTV
ncbi:MAG TPA: phage minor head protein [Flavisolibacter sp.]|nr:phage minor head protein [Flavisolibacter sp.]